MGTYRAKCGVHKMATPLGIARGFNLNVSWGKCGIWLVDQWVPISLCAFVCLTTDCTLRVFYIIILDTCLVIVLIWDIDMLIMLIDYLAWGDVAIFLCFIAISVWDIDMLIMLIDYFACLSIVTLILPWLFCSLHMYKLTVVYHLTWCVDSLACILSWSSLSMLSLSLFILIIITCMWT